MNELRVFITLVNIFCVLGDGSSNEQGYRLIRNQETSNGSLRCGTPSYRKEHACNQVMKKQTEAKIRKLYIPIHEQRSVKKLENSINLMIKRADQKLRENGINRPLSD